jgi:hypothetical protein
MRAFSFVFILLSIQCIGQSATVSAEAISQYRLGDQRAEFDTSIRLVPGGEFVHNNIRTYTYQVNGMMTKPVVISGLTFRNMLLTFDSSETLVSIEVLQLFHSTKDKKYLKTAKTAMATLLPYLNSILGMKPKKKTFYSHRDVSDKGHYWNTGSSIVELRMYQSDFVVRPHASVAIVIRRKLINE